MTDRQVKDHIEYTSTFVSIVFLWLTLKASFLAKLPWLVVFVDCFYWLCLVYFFIFNLLCCYCHCAL